MRRICAFALAAGASGLAEAQSSLVTGYYQNVPLFSAGSELATGGFADFNRLRLTASPRFGAFSLEVAYEQVLTLRENESPAALFIGRVPAGGEWLDLQWTLDESEHVLWQHRFDRLKLGWAPSGSVQIDVGRQVVSWATTLFLTPADPFSPFDPADPFREFRAGIDSARLRIYPGPLSEIDVVVRPTRTETGEELTALGRGLTTWRNWELSGWGGVLYDDLAGAFGASGSLGAWAVRGEVVVREREEGAVVRGTTGVDRRFSLASKDLLVVFEYQHDGLGAEGSDYLRVLESEEFLRGELQVLGRNEAALQGSYQIHPLWSVAGLLLCNLGDGSALVSPSFSYSASDAATISGGFFFGFGKSTPEGAPALVSEYGAVPKTAYVAISLFF